MSSVVNYCGPTQAKIYIVGEAPGAEEEASGKPFVGGAGRILDKLLMDVGITREDCRIANVMKVRPPNNDFSTFYVDKKMTIPKPELIKGRKELWDDIVRVRPNVVCLLGNEPLMALFKHRGITNWRGSILWHQKLGVKVVPTIHPASVMRMWEYCPLVLFDLRRVKEESSTPIHVTKNRKFILAPTFEEVSKEIERLKKCKRIAYDIETTRTVPPILTSIAFADSPLSAICIPFSFSKGTVVTDYWRDEEEMAILLMIQELLEDEKIEKVAQNAQFDNTVLEVNPPGIKVKGLVMDTMCAHHTVYPELKKSLAVLTSIYTRQPYYKHWGKGGADEKFWEYNAMDAAVTFEIAGILDGEMTEFGVKKFYDKFVHPLINILGDIQVRGVLINEQLRDEAKSKTEKELVELQSKIDTAVGRPINVMSSKQLKELLYKDLGFTPIRKRGTGKETTDEEALVKLAFKHQSPIFSLILAIRKRRKLIGTYLDGLVGSDGRTRCSYLIGGDRDGEGGTETGRLSSRESVLGAGTNLQNIPKGVCRKMFIPDSGKVFVEADLSQAEARVVAYLAEEERLINLFTEGGDIHTRNASWIYGKDIKEVAPDERNMAKRLVHASNYGIGPRAFAHHAGIPEREARELLNKYFDTFPSIRSWHLTTRAELSKNRIMTTPMGRKRMFFGRWGEELFRKAYAHVPQSTVADVLNLALIRFSNLISGFKEPIAEIMLQAHDSFVVQCKEEDVESVKKFINQAFDIPILIKGRELRIPIDIEVGRNWEELK